MVLKRGGNQLVRNFPKSPLKDIVPSQPYQNKKKFKKIKHSEPSGLHGRRRWTVKNFFKKTPYTAYVLHNGVSEPKKKIQKIEKVGTESSPGGEETPYEEFLQKKPLESALPSQPYQHKKKFEKEQNLEPSAVKKKRR